MQLAYYLEFLGRILPVALTVAIIFTFFIVQSFGRKLENMNLYLDRIDKHLSAIVYFIEENEKAKLDKAAGGESDTRATGPDSGRNKA